MAVPGTLKVHLSLQWRGTVLQSGAFEGDVRAGNSRLFPFWLEAIHTVPEPIMLAHRAGTGFQVDPPPPFRLVSGTAQVRPGQKSEWAAPGEFTLTAEVDSIPVVVSADWLWVPGLPTGIYTLWKLGKAIWLVLVLIASLDLFKHHTIEIVPPPVLPALTLKKVEPEVKPVKFLPPPPPRLPDRAEDRLSMLMKGQQTGRIFEDAAKKQARREALEAAAKAVQLADVKSIKGKRRNEVAEFRMIGILSSSSDVAILGSLQGAEIGEGFGAGGLGLRGSGEPLDQAKKRGPAKKKAVAQADLLVSDDAVAMLTSKKPDPKDEPTQELQIARLDTVDGVEGGVVGGVVGGEARGGVIGFGEGGGGTGVGLGTIGHGTGTLRVIGDDSIAATRRDSRIQARALVHQCQLGEHSAQLQLTVSETGTVTSARLMRGSGLEKLDACLLATVRGWTLAKPPHETSLTVRVVGP